MKSITYFLSCPDSHIAYALNPDGVILSAWAADSICSFGVCVAHFKSPCVGWVVCTREEYEAIRAAALRFLGLIDQEASHLAQIAEFESVQPTISLS